MASELAKELRESAKEFRFYGYPHTADRMIKAVDEIDRLEQELANSQKIIDGMRAEPERKLNGFVWNYLAFECYSTNTELGQYIVGPGNDGKLEIRFRGNVIGKDPSVEAAKDFAWSDYQRRVESLYE